MLAVDSRVLCPKEDKQFPRVILVKLYWCIILYRAERHLLFFGLLLAVYLILTENICLRKIILLIGEP